MGIVLQRHKINNCSSMHISREERAPSVLTYCESFPNLAALVKFPTPIVVASLPFWLSLFLFLSLSSVLLLSAASLSSPTPFSLRLRHPYTSSLLLLSRRIVGLSEREGISRVLEFWWEFVEDGACCDRVSLKNRGWWWGTELSRKQLIWDEAARVYHHTVLLVCCKMFFFVCELGV